MPFLRLAVLLVWGGLVAMNFLRPGLFAAAAGCAAKLGALILAVEIGRLPILPLILTPVLLLSLAGAGCPLALLLGCRRPGPITSALIGAGTMGGAFLGLGWAGLYRPGLFWIGWAGGLVLAAAYRRAWRPETNLSEWSGASLWIWALRGVTGAFLFLAFLEACSPEWFIDALVYHMFLPEQFLLHGKVTATPWLFLSGYPEPLRALAGSLEAAGGWRLVKIFYWGLSVMAVLAVGEMARGLWRSPAAGSAAQALFASLPLAAKLAGHGQTDLPLAWAVCVSAVWLIRWRRKGGAGRLLMAAVALGTGACFKFSGFLFWGFFAFLLLRGPAWPRAIMLWAAAFWIVMVPCLARNAAIWGNPVAPLFAHVIPTLGWDESVIAVTNIEARVTGWAGSAGSRLASLWLSAESAPDPQAGFTRFGAGELGIILLLGLFPPLLYVRREHARWLAVAAILGAGVWMGWVQALRYMIPIAAIAAGLLAAGGEGWTALLRRVFVVFVLLHNLSLWPRVFGANPTPWLTGSAPANLPAVRDWEEAGVIKWIGELPKGSRTLLLWTFAAYPTGRQAVNTQAWEEPLLLRWARESEDGARLAIKLKQAGITHLALNLPAALRAPAGPFGYGARPLAARRPELFEELFRSRLRLAATRGDSLCYEVKTEGGAPAPEVFVSLRWNDLGGNVHLARWLSERGRPDSAQAMLRSLSALEKSSPYNFSQLSRAWLEAGRPEEAVRQGLRALGSGYDTARLRYVLADALERQGQSAAAARHRARAKALDPYQEEAEGILEAFHSAFCFSGGTEP